QASVTTTVRLSLLRSPRYPDPMADQGIHTHEYAIVVGSDVAEATRAGIEVNTPLRERAGSPVEPLVKVEGDGVVVSAIKLAGDRSGDLIVRLYEPGGRRACAKVTVASEYGPARAVSLLEESIDAPVGAPPESDGTVRLAPFEVLTLRYAAPSSEQSSHD